ncbi:type II toxin-antitoxin system death-on-curing family toxin [Ferruginivarius sediminum]|uniref:Death-on-curing protein n=1 Tax=Ferruginivarius sediminum TaxID=2661937 RepID=A0A369TEM4_9PROT|nr:hypothetical protein [Ferruginivarius sediminum]RDD62587.1 hypothetical protein DRB17_08070 [Ferruginivarius sediminum]
MTSKPDVEPVWLPVEEVRKLNAAEVADIGTGAVIADTGAIERALNRPRVLWHYHDERDVVRLACAHTLGLLEERPFGTGNLATGLATLMLFLEANGYRWTGPDGPVLSAYVRALANQRYTEEGLAESLRPDIFPT